MLLKPGFVQVNNATGAPYAGAKSYFYATGTTTPVASYQDALLTITHAVPVVADAEGRFPEIFLPTISGIRQKIFSAVDVLIVDLDPVNDVSGGLPATSTAAQNDAHNSAFQFSQRNGTTNTATSDDTYAIDRWNILTQTASVQVQQIIEPEDGYPTYMRITQNQAAAQRCGFSQIFEGQNSKKYRGNNGVNKIRVRSSLAQTIRYVILAWTGTEDAVTSDVVNNWASAAYTPGNFFNASNLSVVAVGSFLLTNANQWQTSPDLTGAMGSSLKNVVIFAWSDQTMGQNSTIDVDMVKMEVGSVSTPWEVPDVSINTIQCLRYTWVYNADVPANLNVLGTFMGNTAAQAQAWNTFPVPMRTVPSLTSTGTAHRVGALPGGAITGGVTLTIDGGATKTCLSLTTSPVGGGAAVYGQLYAGDTTTRTVFSAEM